MEKYDPKTLEPKWQQVWADTNLYRAIDGDPRPKYYMLTEFPYPSGDGLHAGHTREYTIGDVIARYKRMQGHNVLYPMGWDAFGLPAENYAIKHKILPQVATARNTANFKRQMNLAGPGLRLVARNQHHRPELLQMDAMAVPAIPQGRSGLPGRNPHQLVPQGKDRPGQRRSRQRPARALRHSGRKEAAQAVDAQNHRLRRSPRGRS